MEGVIESAGRCRLGASRRIEGRERPAPPGAGPRTERRNITNVKSYRDIVGDGGSRVLEQVAEQRARIADGLAGVRHLVAIGSGKGGVGKSTLTLHLAG